MASVAGQSSLLDTIQETGLSRTPSSAISLDVPETDVIIAMATGGSTGRGLDVHHKNDDGGQEEDEEEEGFQYPGHDSDEDNSPSGTDEHPLNDGSEEEEFTYPGSPSNRHGPLVTEVGASVEQGISHPSPAQLEAIYAAGLSGDLELLKTLFENTVSMSEIEPFALVNDASPRTGLTVVHASASRGHTGVVKWLIEECGGIPDLEDKEGETALHKAALNGHLLVVQYLSLAGADIHARDADGWTALHNACSKGYLDIVRWLCEAGGAASDVDGVPGVDVRSKLGWTPLMNASSKGHLPVVLYLLTKQFANPLVRNNWGETAYDAAAAVFEIWICEVLQKAEATMWRGTTVPYDPLAVHTTVPIILHENQRLDVRLKTLAVSGGRPKFSASGLGRNGRRAPFELKLPKLDVDTGKSFVPAWRSDVQLPFIEDPFTLPQPKGGKDGPSREGAERSYFWLSDWTVDLTHPRSDVEDGWQYAHSFDSLEEEWSAEPPPQLERLLSGAGAMTAGFGSPSARGSSGSNVTNSQAWVRRRRWVRVLRRRLDIPPLPFLEADGAMYQISAEGTLKPHMNDDFSIHEDGDGQELGSMPRTFLSLSQDYVARSRYLAGSQHGTDLGSPNEQLSAIDVRRDIAKLERAVMELRMGMLGDEDQERRTQAEVLLNVYSRELDRRRLAAGASGLFISGDDETSYDGNDGASSDGSFHYPGSSPTEAMRTPRPSSIHSQATDYFARPTSSRTSTDLTPHLSLAPEFRVPTHETPQKVMTSRWTQPTPHAMHAHWERDERVSECRGCKRRFSFLFRKHHCRRCGRIFCDRCSSYRAVLDPSDVVHDPVVSDTGHSGSSHRVCQSCFDESNASVPTRLRGLTNSMERIVIDQARLAVPAHMHRVDSSSQISDLADCPVCNQNLADLGTASQQEAHVKRCLEGGVGAVQQPARYLVYPLPGESPLVGVECVICLEEFVKGSLIARLSCLCSFHNSCLSAWLRRGRTCPVHARDA